MLSSVGLRGAATVALSFLGVVVDIVSVGYDTLSTVEGLAALVSSALFSALVDNGKTGSVNMSVSRTSCKGGMESPAAGSGYDDTGNSLQAGTAGIAIGRLESGVGQAEENGDNVCEPS